jgi:uncharacterized protein YbaR (Trm112 family)
MLFLSLFPSFRTCLCFEYTEQMQDAKRIREVLELIVCPACHGKLAITERAAHCFVCGRAYPIEDGIPVLLVERASCES